MRLSLAALAASLMLATTPAATAAESWLVYKNGADGWMFEQSGLSTDDSTGNKRIQVGRYYGTPVEEGGLTWTFEIRRYEIDCKGARTKRGATERYTQNGRPLAPLPPDAGAPWVPASFGWPLRAKIFACSPTPEAGGVKASGKIAGMATMMSLVGSTAATTTAPAQASSTDFCTTIRTVLGEGQKQVPYFSSFYASEGEKSKFAGLGSRSVPGFGTCRIQQAMTQPHKGLSSFASYYCEKKGGTEADNATFAATVSKQVETCLPGSLFLEGNDGGHSIKTREYAVTMAGFPRVRVQHHKDGVTLYLDAK